MRICGGWSSECSDPLPDLWAVQLEPLRPPAERHLSRNEFRATSQMGKKKKITETTIRPALVADLLAVLSRTLLSPSRGARTSARASYPPHRTLCYVKLPCPRRARPSDRGACLPHRVLPVRARPRCDRPSGRGACLPHRVLPCRGRCATPPSLSRKTHWPCLLPSRRHPIAS